MSSSEDEDEDSRNPWKSALSIYIQRSQYNRRGSGQDQFKLEPRRRSSRRSSSRRMSGYEKIRRGSGYDFDKYKSS